MLLRAVLSAALLCLGASGASVRHQLVKEVLPGIGSYYFHPYVMNWTDAATYCRTERNAILAYPNSLDEANMMSAMMKTYKTSYIHVGFHDKYKEGEYYTLTGERVSQSCFKTWMSQTGSPDKNCGAFRDYPGILDIPCNTKYPFICVNYNFYREDFEFIPGHGYYKMHRAQRTWADAQQTCEAEGAQLLVLNSEGELAALSNRYGQFTAWVGVHHLHVNWQFLSILDEPLISTGFSRWEIGQPSGTNDQNPFLIINSTPGYGLALRRATDTHSFICEHRQGALRPPPL